MNRALEAAELICGDGVEVDVLFQPEAAYLAAGVFAGTTEVVNGRISVVKAVLRGATSLGLIAGNPITATITKSYRVLRPPPTLTSNPP